MVTPFGMESENTPTSAAVAVTAAEDAALLRAEQMLPRAAAAALHVEPHEVADARHAMHRQPSPQRRHLQPMEPLARWAGGGGLCARACVCACNFESASASLCCVSCGLDVFWRGRAAGPRDDVSVSCASRGPL